MKFAYADPPYLGMGKKFYGDLHDEAHIWDDIAAHRQLIERLCDEFSDGWALSLSTPSLTHLLPLCPPTVRVCAWVKPFAAFKANVGVAYAWEPVLVMGGRKRTREQPTVRDWLAESITLQKGLTGAKPERFCRWILSVLNAEAGDEVVDLFPGTGVMGKTWERWQRRPMTDIGGPRTGSSPDQMLLIEIDGRARLEEQG
jgi:hypothetical protein